MNSLFDDRRCDLGEGPLWHPERGQLFWFDILNRRLLSRTEEGPQEWHFGEMVSAAGWVSRDELLIASEKRLFRFNLNTGEKSTVATLESEETGTRSNDGRADPQGGFWIGTMGKRGGEDVGMGSIHRLYRGELRKIFRNITIPNAISFTPDGKWACFSDTVTHKVMRTALDSEGWPLGEPEVFLDFTRQKLLPDGAVFDQNGVFWVAQWGAGRVAAYGPDGGFVRDVRFAAGQTSCPAFGGADLSTLFCTTALEGMSPEARAAEPDGGKTFTAPGISRGQREHRVIL